MYFSPPLFSCWIRDPGWKNLCLVSGIKYVGSATLVVGMASPPIPRCLTQPLGSNVLKVEQLKKYASSEKLNYDSLCYRFRIKIFTFKKLYVSICNLSYFSTFISLKIYLRWVKQPSYLFFSFFWFQSSSLPPLFSIPPCRYISKYFFVTSNYFSLFRLTCRDTQLSSESWTENKRQKSA